MSFFRFMTLTTLTTALGFGLIASALSKEPTAKRSESTISASTETPALDWSQAQILQPGEGLSDLEVQQAEWITDLADEDRHAGQDALVRLLIHGQTTTGRQSALQGLIATDTEHWPTDYRGDFLRSLAPGALDAALSYGVPASVTMAQAIQESGWGRSQLAKQHHNLFGVKASASQSSVLFKTDEYEQGQRILIEAQFRTFSSPSAAIHHHGELLSQDERYADALANGAHWRVFLSNMAPIYASDPAYETRVEWLIERYELDRWDPLVNEVISKAV